MSKEMVNSPAHYNRYPIETIDMMERIFGLQATIQWCIMTAFKYRMRMGMKDDMEQIWQTYSMLIRSRIHGYTTDKRQEIRDQTRQR